MLLVRGQSDIKAASFEARLFFYQFVIQVRTCHTKRDNYKRRSLLRLKQSFGVELSMEILTGGLHLFVTSCGCSKPSCTLTSCYKLLFVLCPFCLLVPSRFFTRVTQRRHKHKKKESPPFSCACACTHRPTCRFVVLVLRVPR